MTGSVQGDLSEKDGVRNTRRRPPLMWLLLVLLTLEFLAMVGVCVYLVAALFVSHPTSYAGGVAFLVLALVAALWLAYIVVGALRGRAWIRGASIVWQVIQFAIGIGCFQGLTFRANSPCRYCVGMSQFAQGSAASSSGSLRQTPNLDRICPEWRTT